jgi:hypothetical protein
MDLNFDKNCIDLNFAAGNAYKILMVVQLVFSGPSCHLRYAVYTVYSTIAQILASDMPWIRRYKY